MKVDVGDLVFCSGVSATVCVFALSLLKFLGIAALYVFLSLFKSSQETFLDIYYELADLFPTLPAVVASLRSMTASIYWVFFNLYWDTYDFFRKAHYPSTPILMLLLSMSLISTTYVFQTTILKFLNTTKTFVLKYTKITILISLRFLIARLDANALATPELNSPTPTVLQDLAEYNKFIRFDDYPDYKCAPKQLQLEIARLKFKVQNREIYVHGLEEQTERLKRERSNLERDLAEDRGLLAYYRNKSEGLERRVDWLKDEMKSIKKRKIVVKKPAEIIPPALTICMLPVVNVAPKEVNVDAERLENEDESAWESFESEEDENEDAVPPPPNPRSLASRVTKGNRYTQAVSAPAIYSLAGGVLEEDADWESVESDEDGVPPPPNPRSLASRITKGNGYTQAAPAPATFSVAGEALESAESDEDEDEDEVPLPPNPRSLASRITKGNGYQGE